MGIADRVKHALTSYAADEKTRKNIVNSIIDGAWYSAMVGLTTPFMGVYALQLGATDTMLGWLASLPALVALFSQIPAAIVTQRQRSRLKVLVPYCLLFRSGYLLFAFIPFLPLAPVTRAWVFIGLLALMNFPNTVCGVAWSAMMGDIFPSKLRGRVFGDRNMLLGLVTMLCTMAAGPLLDKLPYPFNFVTLFVLSFLALMMSLVYLVRISEKPPESEPLLPKPVKHSVSSIMDVMKDKSFLYFITALFVVHLGFNISAAMWTILNVKVLYLSKTFIATINVTSQLLSALTYRWWGRFSDRYSARFALLVSILLFAPQPWLHNFVRSPWPLLPLAVLNGFAGAGFNLVLFNVLLDIAPDERLRPSYIAVFHTIMGITAFVTPIVGVTIYKASSMSVVFDIATTLRLAGLGLMVWKLDIRIPQTGSKRKGFSPSL